MKQKPIVADPYQFLRAGIHAMSEAATLTHLARCGMIGSRVDDLCEAVGIGYNTAQTVLDRLRDKGLVTRYARSNRQGRAFYWTVSPDAWALLTREPDLTMFPSQQSKTA